MTRSATAIAYDLLDNARTCYADENGDGVGGFDWIGAGDVEDEGRAIGKAALEYAGDDREAFIEAQLDRHPRHAAYLLNSAARYEIACGEEG